MYFSSDPHYFHNNIIKYCKRPFKSVEDMNEQLIQNWNRLVKPDEESFILGDISFARIELTLNVLSRLNGKIHLILGNHDSEIRKNKNMLIETGIVESIQPYKEIRIDGKMIVLFHYGCRVWNKAHHGSYLLFGHSHGSLPPFGRSVDVGVDSTWITGKAEYRPFSLNEINEFMEKREIETEDAHGKRPRDKKWKQ